MGFVGLPEENKEDKRDTVSGRFLPGHPKSGGRTPGIKNWNYKRLAESMGVNPLRVVLEVIKTGYKPLARGERPEDQQKVPMDIYFKLLMDAVGYCTAKPMAVQITGADEGPISIATLDVTKLMADPALAAAAQTLALGITSATINQPPEPEMIEGETEDIDPTPPQETTE